MPVKIVRSGTEDGATLDVLVTVLGQNTASVAGADGHRLTQLLGKWSNGRGIGNPEFDIESTSVTLRRCRVSKMSGRSNIEVQFMERE
ncbi:MAG TPA: hypothetical protein VIK01_26665 [Polyangiaceae bacterium]